MTWFGLNSGITCLHTEDTGALWICGNVPVSNLLAISFCQYTTLICSYQSSVKSSNEPQQNWISDQSLAANQAAGQLSHHLIERKLMSLWTCLFVTSRAWPYESSDTCLAWFRATLMCSWTYKSARQKACGRKKQTWYSSTRNVYLYSALAQQKNRHTSYFPSVTKIWM